jgi:hypothetical protein
VDHDIATQRALEHHYVYDWCSRNNCVIWFTHPFWYGSRSNKNGGANGDKATSVELKGQPAVRAGTTRIQTLDSLSMINQVLESLFRACCGSETRVWRNQSHDCAESGCFAKVVMTTSIVWDARYKPHLGLDRMFIHMFKPDFVQTTFVDHNLLHFFSTVHCRWFNSLNRGNDKKSCVIHLTARDNTRSDLKLTVCSEPLDSSATL